MIQLCKKMMFLLLFSFVGLTIVQAESCPNEVRKELSRKAANVKLSYEVIDKSEEKELEIEGNKTTYKVPNYSFDITLYNMSEGIEANIKTTNERVEKTIGYGDTTEGMYTIRDKNMGEIYNYVVEIKSSGECSGLTLRTLKMTKPRYNAYSEYKYCENSTVYYCQRFIGTEINIKSTDEFIRKINVNQGKVEEKGEITTGKKKGIGEKIRKHWKIYLTLSVGAITIVSIMIALVMRKRREKKRVML